MIEKLAFLEQRNPYIINKIILCSLYMYLDYLKSICNVYYSHQKDIKAIGILS